MVDQPSILTEEAPATRAALRVKSAKLQEAVRACLDRTQYPTEKLEVVVEAMEAAGRRDRIVFGALWPWQHRCVLAITNLRLLELAVRPLGRGLEGRIRSFPWYRVTDVSLGDGRLVLSSSSSEGAAWALRFQLDPRLLQRVRQRPAPCEERFGGRVCDRCGTATFTKYDRCSKCRARPLDRRTVSRLAWCCPGAGLLAARHPVLAASRAVLELAAWLGLVYGILWADDVFTLAGVLLAGAMVLPLIKLESACMARHVAQRCGCGVGRPWHGSIPLLRIGVLVAGIAVVAPLIWAGAMSRRVSADLDFVVAREVWQGSRVCSEWPEGCDDPELRSRWTHRDGWTVRLAARPWPPFADQDDVRDQITTLATGNAARVTVGPHDGLRTRAASTAADGDQSQVTIRLHVLDPVGRDLHTLSTEAPTELAEERERALEELLRLGIWVWPRPPRG